MTKVKGPRVQCWWSDYPLKILFFPKIYRQYPGPSYRFALRSSGWSRVSLGVFGDVLLVVVGGFCGVLGGSGGGSRQSTDKL